MPWLIMLAVAAALSMAETAPLESIAEPLRCLSFMSVGVGLVVAAAFVGSRVFAWQVRRRPDDVAMISRQFDNFKSLHAILWFAMSGTFLFELEWAQLVRSNVRLGSSCLAVDLVVLTPILGPLLLSWAAFYDFDREVNRLLIGKKPFPSRGAYVAQHARPYFGVALAPVLACVAVQDGIRLAAPDFLDGHHGPLGLVASIVLVMAFFPQLLCRVWKTEALGDGVLRDRLEACARRMGAWPREILIWHTGGMMANAAVAGFVPGMRYVFLTDGLLCRLSDEEVEAVFAHEIGHLCNRHLGRRLLMLILPVALWALVSALFSSGLPELNDVPARSAFDRYLTWIGPLCLIVYSVTFFAWYCRRLEFEADVFACRALDPYGALTADGIDRFITALGKLSAGAPRARLAWLHPRLEARVQSLRALEELEQTHAAAHDDLTRELNARRSELEKIVKTAD